MKTKMSCWLNIKHLGYAVFWSWNLVFGALVLFGLLPGIALALVVALSEGDISWNHFATLVFLVSIPLLAMYYAVRYMPDKPREQLHLFYGIEAPAFVFGMMRLFFLRQLNPAMVFLSGGLVLCLASYAYFLHRPETSKHKGRALTELVAATGLLVGGVYLALLLAFYVLPLLLWLAQTLLRLQWLDVLIDVVKDGEFPLAVLFSMFLFLVAGACTLFLGLPVALPPLYISAWKRRLQGSIPVLGPARAIAATSTTIAVVLLAMVFVSRQPQQGIFQMFASPAVTEEDKVERLAKSVPIQAGLLNAYLAPYRYIGSTGENNHIEAMYADVFHSSRSRFEELQAFHNFLARPLLYDGETLDGDQSKAAEHYAFFFDRPIQRAEAGPIRDATLATWNRAEVEAGLLDRDQKRVRLSRQEFEVKELGPLGPVAEIEIYEVYENQTSEQQEILYYFSLPETAAVTGLWLGSSPDRAERSAYRISPRGAAQTVYRSEVKRRVDPALIEQVGPRQYRLRAFPVPPKLFDREAPEHKLHLWMTIRVLGNGSSWPMPELLEKRNIFWDKRTERVVQGALVPASSSWLPLSMPRKDTATPGSAAFSTRLGDLSVEARPVSMSDPSDFPGGRYAVVVDTSRSMACYAGELENFLRRLSKLVSNRRRFDIYWTEAGREAPLTLQPLAEGSLPVLYGSLHPEDLLVQFHRSRRGLDYDAVLVLTDEGAYDFASTSRAIPEISEPIWIVHLGGRLPVAYDDGLFKALASSGGGTATSLEELATKLVYSSSTAPSWFADGYLWSFGAAADESTAAKGLEPLAARQWIHSRTRGKEQIELEDLDAVHASAIAHSVVTPFSSMIVLVNERQHQMLNELEKGDDRFERESEDGTEELTKPVSPLAVPGVPEPEEWVLIILAGVMLALMVWREKRSPAGQSL